MADPFQFPFEPPWGDLRASGMTQNGCRYYIFDSCVERDPEKRAQLDREIADIAVRAERRRFLEGLAAEGE